MFIVKGPTNPDVLNNIRTIIKKEYERLTSLSQNTHNPDIKDALIKERNMYSVTSSEQIFDPDNAKEVSLSLKNNS